MHYDKTNDVYGEYASICDGMLQGRPEEVNSAYKEGNKLTIKTIEETSNSKITRYYEYKKDAKNGNYVFVNYTEKTDE